MIQNMRTLIRDENGATMVEYALVLSLIAAVCLVGAGLVSRAVADKWGFISGQLP